MAFESVDCGKLWRFSGSGPEIKLGLFWIEAWSISAWANERWLVSIYILNCCAGLLFSTLICEQALVDDQSPKLFTVNYHTWVDMFGISNVLSSSIFCQFLVSIITYTKYTQFKVHTFWKCLLQFSIILKLWLVVVWLFLDLQVHNCKPRPTACITPNNCSSSCSLSYDRFMAFSNVGSPHSAI